MPTSGQLCEGLWDPWANWGYWEGVPRVLKSSLT